MKTVLVIASHLDLADSIRDILVSGEYRVFHRVNLADAASALHQLAISACIVDLVAPEDVKVLEVLRRRLAHRPLIVYTDLNQGGAEERAYLHGADHVLGKPLRPHVLNLLLSRLDSRQPFTSERPPSSPRQTIQSIQETGSAPAQYWNLDLLRKVATLLLEPLSVKGFFQELLRLLVETSGIHRIVLFLRHRSVSDRFEFWLPPVAMQGCSFQLPEHFGLSTESGIGSLLFREGRILRASELAGTEIAAEFQCMGAEVAIPILDQNDFLGVAAFGQRLTSRALSDHELELIFHLFSQVGRAVRNIWRHEQLISDYGMLWDVWEQVSSACLVVTRDLEISLVNKSAQRLFSARIDSPRRFEFNDLPAGLTAKVSQVLRTGLSVAPFLFSLPGVLPSEYQISIRRLPACGERPESVLLLAEDKTNAKEISRREIDAAKQKAQQEMAARMAHEIGNALVPISTYQQLMNEQINNPDFQASFAILLGDAVRRLTDLTNQMRSLGKGDPSNGSAI